VGEFEVSFPTPRPYHTLSELKLKGFVERVGRGRYRAVAPDAWAERKAEGAADVERALEASSWPFAFTASSAVHAWTGGRYSAGSTAAYRPVEIAVRASDVPAWRRYLSTRGVGFRKADERRTSAGAEVVLHRRKKLEVAHVDGMPVETREWVVAYIRRHPSIFGPAEELVVGD
jgi:hypothetical protein